MKSEELDKEEANYSVIWKYKIKPESKEKFEYEYGPHGAWFMLFNKSRSYSGSYLYKNEEEKNTYVLIDTWADKQSYEDFKKINAEAYTSLSAQFESLYETEEKIGSFNSIK